MPLLGPAAMLLTFDIVPEAIAEHDDWHTHEHLPERLSIAGFIRGSRWVVISGQPRYIVIYEVAQLQTLTSEPYLHRLNNPTPWTSKMMPFYRGMRRGLCAVTGSVGLGVGHLALLVRMTPTAATSSLRNWLVNDVLARHASRPGMGSIHLLEEAASAPMTNEQRIRGADSSIGWAVLATGYSLEALTDLSHAELGSRRLEQQGATGLSTAIYRLDYSLTCSEIDGGPSRRDGFCP